MKINKQICYSPFYCVFILFLSSHGMQKETSLKIKNASLNRPVTTGVVDVQKKSLPGFEKLLNIESNSLRKKIFDLVQEKKWNEIDALIMNIKDMNVLNDLIIFQMDIAIIIANQIKFNVVETQAFDIGRLPINMSKYKVTTRIKIQWLSALLLYQRELKKNHQARSAALIILNRFLGDIGYVQPKVSQISSSPRLNELLAANFKKLFETLFMVTTLQPKILPYLEDVKKELNIY